MKNKIKQDTWLPIFTGYYESIFDGSNDFIEYETNLSESEYQDHYKDLFKAGISYEFFTSELGGYCDFTDAFNEASESISHALENLESCDIILDVEYQKTVSPKYYNFSTDSINCAITYDPKKLKKYITENMTEFTKYIGRKYTSRSGFSSSYSNNVSDWLDFDDLGDHGLGSVLEFVLENENDEAEYTLYEEANISEDFSNYVKIDFDRMIQDFKTQQNKAV